VPRVKLKQHLSEDNFFLRDRRRVLALGDEISKG